MDEDRKESLKRLAELMEDMENSKKDMEVLVMAVDAKLAEFRNSLQQFRRLSLSMIQDSTKAN